MSYGAKLLRTCIRRAADYVDKILRGAKPADFRSSSRPSSIWSQPDHRQGARPRVPPTLLARADEVIE